MRERERGMVMALAAVFLVAVIAISAIAIEVSRLTDTATEVQVAADAAAMAAAQNLTRGGTQASATAAAQAVAAQNSTDGRTPSSDNVSPIEFGSYTAAAGFRAGGTPVNAVRATVSIPNVQFILANVFGQGSSTTVTKRGAAAFRTLGTGRPQLPIVLGECFSCNPGSGNCTTSPITITFNDNRTAANNSSFMELDCNNSDCTTIALGTGLCDSSKRGIEKYVPTVAGCGSGGGVTGPTICSGESLTLNNGAKNPVCADFDCLKGNGQSYLVPIVQNTCGTPFNQTAPVIGFASVTIVDVNCDNKANALGTPGNTMIVQPRFIDCNDPGNAQMCQGSVLGGSCPECGTGEVTLIAGGSNGAL